MRVIGKSSGGFILDASSDEVANILGYYYHGYIPQMATFKSAELLR
jgi:hypothetical protein